MITVIITHQYNNYSVCMYYICIYLCIHYMQLCIVLYRHICKLFCSASICNFIFSIPRDVQLLLPISFHLLCVKELLNKKLKSYITLHYILLQIAYTSSKSTYFVACLMNSELWKRKCRALKTTYREHEKKSFKSSLIFSGQSILMFSFNCR